MEMNYKIVYGITEEEYDIMMEYYKELHESQED